VDSTELTITANAKDGDGFLLGTLFTLLVAGLVLLYKETADTRLARIEAAKTGSDVDKQQAPDWGLALKESLNLGWIATTVAALVTTFGALYALWENNPAWGESGRLASIIALVGVGLAAVGARTVLTPSTGKSPDQASAD
jgi:hypothetical protein